MNAAMNLDADPGTPAGGPAGELPAAGPGPVPLIHSGEPRMSARSRERLAAWLFLAPAIAYLLFAFALPIVYNVFVHT